MPGFVTAAVTALVVILGTTSAAAQGFPRTEISGGYQLVNMASPLDPAATGWYADIAGNFTRVFGVVFQAGGNYKEITQTLTNAGFTVTMSGDLHVHQFMGGMRANVRVNPVSPFAEFLVGGINGSTKVEGSVVGDGRTLFSTSGNDWSAEFAIQAAGGATFSLTNRLGARATFGYLRMFPGGDSVGIVRVAAGAVFSF